MITEKDLGKVFRNEFNDDVFYIRAIRNGLKRCRNRMALKHIESGGVHIDLGCGDCSLLKLSPAEKKIGLDRLYGDAITDKLPFADKAADQVTMLAFIEHLDEPAALIREIDRVLKPTGRLIMTTPLRGSELFLRLWNKDIGEEHKMYFDRPVMEEMLYPHLRIKVYERFFLNQLFVCVKG
jgi:ubiquinone/menaquinone biosynthesis C-methylase UbiE